ncbi:MAG TPA: hypothetical protein VL371_18800, partial [Gemmataceae bacterium]|nr:hypothetical protein [Gemmataceae bacterium]
MTLFKLLRRNHVFHRRGNLAVLLGVAVGTAVLTGALLVGDSLRGSLRDRVMKQFRNTTYMLSAGRFFQEATAEKAIRDPASRAIVLQGSARTADDGSDTGRRVNKVAVFGLKLERFEEGAEYYD